MQAKRIWTILTGVLLPGVLLGGLVACSGDKSGGMTDTPAPKSMSEKESEVTDQDVADVMADGEQHDEEFHKRVLDRGSRKAEECAAMGAPTDEEGEVTITFDGKKGRVTEVELGYPFADASDQAQKCLKNSFIGEMIPPFEGTIKTPHKLTIPKADDKSGAGKKKD